MNDRQSDAKAGSGLAQSPDASEKRYTDEARKTLASSLELARRASELDSLEDLQYFLVNDLRVLIQFDRSFLITHMGRSSQVRAAANQPTLEARSRIYEGLMDLSQNLRGLKKGLLLRSDLNSNDKVFEDLKDHQKRALAQYIEVSGCSYLFMIPLIKRNTTVASLLLEFFDAPPPTQTQAVALLSVAPILSSLLVERWIIDKHPRVISRIVSRADRANSQGLLRRNLKWLIPLTALIIAAVLLWPIDVEVGGEAQVTSLKKNIAFCRMDGLIERVLVTEGELVNDDQILAILDPTDLNYQIESAGREYELLVKKLNTLSVESDVDPTKLAEAQLVDLRRKKVWNDLQYHKWRRRFLEIRAPTSGVILTKDIQSVTGKKLKAGEPFCELGKPSELAVDVFVPDKRASKARLGQKVKIYLNNDPLNPFPLSVDKIAPSAEVIPRLGNVCRVRAEFTNAPDTVKIGMKGIGKIHVGESTPWELIKTSMAEKLNYLSLYF